METSKNVTPEQITERLIFLEKLVKSPYRDITLFSDPSLQSFCCGIIPKKTINEKGEVVEEIDSEKYMIGVPQIYIAGDSGQDFLRGEVIHEQGHAYWTNFKNLRELSELAENEGYKKQDMSNLLNVLEDPRMERLQGGPQYENARKLLFEKNRKSIIPNLSKAVVSEDLSKKERLYFLIKLEQIWQLHAEELEGVEKPWDINNVDPDIHKVFSRIKNDLDTFTGTNEKIPLKNAKKIKQMVEDVFWPAAKELIEIDKEEGRDKKPDDSDGNGENKNNGEEGDPSESTGEPENDLEGQMLDPKNIDSWPENIKQAFKRAMRKEEERLEKDSEEKKEEYEKKQLEKKEDELSKHERLAQKDGFSNSESREKYNQLLSELRPVISKLKKVFDKYVPASDNTGPLYGTRGGKYKIKKHIRNIGTGNEKPMERKIEPMDKAFVLQLLIDVSGSMFNENHERINNAMKTAVAVAEAAADSNVYLQILANDDLNFKDDEKYKIFDFSDKIKKGNTREKVMGITSPEKFGGANSDGEAIEVALQELKMSKRKLQGKHDKLGTLMLYISDATTPEQTTKDAVKKAREFSSFEGTAITSEGDIVESVKKQFGEDSLVPENISDLPNVISRILRKNLLKLK
jgi:hypothetical protein